jgi:hypothetical protein
LADGTFTQLRLGSIAIATANLMVNTELSRSVPASCVNLKRVPQTDRYFGRIVRVQEIVLTGVAGETLSSGPLSLQLLNGQGKAVGSPQVVAPVEGKKAVFEFPHSALAAGFEVTSATGVKIGDTVMTPYGSLPSYQLDSDFQLAMASSAWHLTSTQEQYSVFKAAKVLPEAWLTSPATNGRVTTIQRQTHALEHAGTK